MKYISQILLISLFSFLGELCRFLIPYPIPASIYGMVLLAAALALKLISVEAIRDTGSFLTTLLPILFVPPLVNLMEYWDQLKGNLIAIGAITLVSSVAVFAVSGLVTQALMKKKGGKEDA